MKHISTVTKAVAMLWVVTAIQPIIGVTTAPPIIAITKNEAPRVVFSPRFFRPNAKIVGYIRDMKKLTHRSATSPTQPGNKTATRTRNALVIPNAPINLFGRMNFIR